jgi:hypothetical protein
MKLPKAGPACLTSRWGRQFAATAPAWFGLLIADTAWAGRPLLTEDAGVLASRACELESFLARPQGWNTTVRSAQISCGASDRTQLGIALANETSSSTSQLTLAGKTALIELTADRAGLALAYGAVWQQSPHERFRHQAMEAKAVLTMPVGRYLVHANTGWIGHRGTEGTRADRLTWNLALERPNAIDAVDLMTELVGDNKNAPWMNVAARWAIVPGRLFLDGSWGIQGNARKDKQLTLGIKIGF